MSQIDQYPTAKTVICLLGMGTLLAGSILMPGLGVAAGAIYRYKKARDWDKQQKLWKKFNFGLLRRNLKRLHQQKIVEIVVQDGQEVVKLTQKGRSKYFRFSLEGLSLKDRHWDDQWRLVLYDISKVKKPPRKISGGF